MQYAAYEYISTQKNLNATIENNQWYEQLIIFLHTTTCWKQYLATADGLHRSTSQELKTTQQKT